ncbi:MAG: acetyl-CoA carboxylase, carboxyltransferase subunit beta [Chitinophagales bacterium]|nr:acetyl-CoA carboxylase carboxyltransferase subunit beta [Bacteroidota bacterium]MCB9044443.1 acetyl-CoA carboxylase carboxyltransferase subunit beta [Chitinophagales bacterium]
MSWFKRITSGINTQTSQKKEVPDGLWFKCKKCRFTGTQKELSDKLFVCPSCGTHYSLSAQQYFELLFDEEKFEELFNNIEPEDFLQFSDLRSYKTRIAEATEKTGLKDAVRVGKGTLEKQAVVIVAMDFGFIGGSMGSVVGEKIALAIDYCIKHKLPLIIISKSGGARMMESAFSLMQMAKTAAKLTQLAEAQLPYISLLTDPTTGGVTASYAMLGDVNLAEPNALIAFAGPRVVKETIKKDLPPGFQRSEFLLEKGFLDRVVPRQKLKAELGQILSFFAH